MRGPERSGGCEAGARKQERSPHIELHAIAVGELGMIVEDVLLLARVAPPPVQQRQGHSRRNLSYIWGLRRAEGER